MLKLIDYNAVFRIFKKVPKKMRITDQGVGPAWQRQSGARRDKDSPVLYGLSEQDQELE